MKIKFISPNNFSYQIARFLKEREHQLIKDIREVDQVIVVSISESEEIERDLEINPNVYLIYYHWDLPLFRDLNSEYYQRYKRLLERANEVWSASEASKNILKEIWNIESEVIYMPLDEREYKNIPKTNNNEKYISAGRIRPHKNFPLFEKACRDLNLNYESCHPEGRYGRDDMTYYDEDNLYPKISKERKIFLTKLKNCKCYVSCSTSEGLGLPPIEATYFRVPILISDIEVNKEIHGNTALYFKRDNVEDLKRALKEIEQGRKNNIEEAFLRTKRRNKHMYENLIRKKYAT